MRHRDDLPPALQKPVEEQIPRVAFVTSEAAKAVGLCEKTLKSLGANGPPFFKCGIKRLYPVNALVAWASAMAAAKAELSTGGGSDGDVSDEVG